MHYKITEGKRQFIYKDLIYDPKKWSASAKEGTPVQKQDVSGLTFTINSTQSSTSPVLTLTDVGNVGIAWLDSTGAESIDSACTSIRIKFGANTLTKSGTGYYYELTAKMTDGSYISIEEGTIDIIATVTGNP